MRSFQYWRVAILVLLLFLLAIPLYQLERSDVAAGSYYKQYIYDHISRYLVTNDGVYNNTLFQDGHENSVRKEFNFSSPCENFPDTRGILLVMKTGATEAYEKLPTHFVTHMQCLSDFLIFSDLEQQIGKYHLYDALDRVSDAIRDSRSEFELYRAMQDCPISQADCTKGLTGGWDLDKYKFLHMMVKSWEMRPNMDWYVFAEADSYIVWSNLAYWLRKKQNHHSNSYIGSVVLLQDVPFAHGGSGYVLSGTLLKKIVKNIPDVAAKYDQLATETCCGDYLVSVAVEEVGAKVRNAHPMFNGEKPSTLPYGPGHWCEPLLSMHHMNAEEVAAVWQYEQTKTKKKHIQIKDMYHTFFAPKLTSQRQDWDNLSWDKCYIAQNAPSQDKAQPDEIKRQVPESEKNAVERRAHIGPKSCSLVCVAEGIDISNEEYDAVYPDEQKRETFVMDKYDERSKVKAWNKERKCFQWRFHDGVCCTSRSFKLGAPRREKEEAKKWVSGWFVRGIENWVGARGDCGKIEWKDPW